MQLFKNLSIANKLLVLVFVAAFFVAAVAVTGYYFLAQTNAVMQGLDQNELKAVKVIGEMQANIRSAQATAAEYLLNVDEERRIKLRADLQASAALVNKALGELEATNLSEDQRRNLDLLKSMMTSYRSNRDAALQFVDDKRVKEAIIIYTHQSTPVLDGINRQLGFIADEFNEKARAAFEKSSQGVTTASMLLTGIGLFALVLVLVLGFAIARMVANPLRQVAATVADVAAGNLQARRVAVDSRDEAGQVAAAINTMTENLRTLIRQVAGSAEQVAAASEELNASADQAAVTASQVAESIASVANSSATQLKAVEASSAAVEQMSATVEQVKTNAGVVADTSAQAAETAEQGAEQITSAVQQIANIEKTVADSAQIVQTLGDRSKEIGQIVDTISSIAGQTNLLALNAAIESARAGEAGRGFAVVAEEVRKLAEQSQDASKQIGELIGAIQADTDRAVAAMLQGTREVKRGSEVVNTAGQAFEQILVAVNRVSAQAQDMSQAIGQMAAGSEQIVAAMKDIDEASKTTAAETQTVSASTEEQSATMEEIASSSQGLASLAQDLQTVVRKFTV
jgi:methyl-accepting chemotaxis protein